MPGRVAGGLENEPRNINSLKPERLCKPVSGYEDAAQSEHNFYKARELKTGEEYGTEASCIEYPLSDKPPRSCDCCYGDDGAYKHSARRPGKATCEPDQCAPADPRRSWIMENKRE